MAMDQEAMRRQYEAAKQMMDGGNMRGGDNRREQNYNKGGHMERGGKGGPADPKAQTDISKHVRDFLEDFKTDVQEGKAESLEELYTNDFQKHSQKMANQLWPQFALAQVHLGEDLRVEILYKELYYRHMYSKQAAIITPEDRLASWENYKNLFDKLQKDLSYEKTTGGAPPNKLRLPLVYLWDLVDEFVFQYQRFALFKKETIVKNKNGDALAILRENPSMWDPSEVHNLLQTFVHHSGVLEYIQKMAKEEQDGTSAPGPNKEEEQSLFLGYFAQIQIVRLTTLFGSFDGSLEELQKLDYGHPTPLFYRSPAAHLAFFYYAGFSLMMLNRFSDAIGLYNQVLYFILRVQQRFPALAQQYESQSKTVDKLFSLLLINMSLSPDNYHNVVEPLVMYVIKDKHAEKMEKLTLTANITEEQQAYYSEVFTHVCPKFVPIEQKKGETVEFMDGYHRTYELFKKMAFEDQKWVPVIQSYLKMYTSLTLDNLARICNLEQEEMKKKLEHVQTQSEQTVIGPGGSIRPGAKAYCSDVKFELFPDGKIEVEVLKPHKDYTALLKSRTQLLQHYVAVN